MKLAIDGGRPLLKPLDLNFKPGKEEIQSVLKTMKEGNLSDFEGRFTVREFEKKFARFHSIPNAVAFNSGTAAIHSSIAAMAALEGGEVLVPAYTFITGVTPLLLENLKFVFVDIDRKNLGMDSKKAKEQLNSSTVGLLPAHLYGFPCDILRLSNLAQKQGLFLIEDACQAHGARVGKKRVGTFGDAGTFSFYPRKNMTTGEGGMAITSKESVYSTLRTMRQCGKSKPDSLNFERLGWNYRMTDLQAAVGIPQLAKLEKNNKARRTNAKFYTKRFKRLGFETIPIQEGTTPVYFKYPLLLPEEIAAKKTAFANALRAENVPLVPFNTLPLPRVPFLKEIAERKGFRQRFWEETFPVSEEVHHRLINFWTTPKLSTQQVEHICDAVEKVVNHSSW